MLLMVEKEMRGGASHRIHRKTMTKTKMNHILYI